jgi:hypothetical protein
MERSEGIEHHVFTVSVVSRNYTFVKTRTTMLLLGETNYDTPCCCPKAMGKRSNEPNFGTGRGYGWLHIGDGSRPRFLVREDTEHRVRLVVLDEGTYAIRCSRFNCGFRQNEISSLGEAQNLARKHTIEMQSTKKKRRRK